MALLAAAFHRSVAVAEQEKLFSSDFNKVFAGSAAAKCPDCDSDFAIFYAQKDDADNDKHLANLMKLIHRDCGGGQHPAKTYRISG